MKATKLILLVAFVLGAFACTPVMAASTTSIDADSLRSADRTKTWTPPAATDTLVGRASTDTLTGKTISGASNTFAALPVGASIVQEAPTGTVNGSNTTFSLSFSPVSVASLLVHLDGLALIQGSGQDYTISGSTITMTTAPALGQSILVTYSRY